MMAAIEGDTDYPYVDKLIRSVGAELSRFIDCGASVGPEYEGVVIEFGLNVWDIERASQRSDSLRRARNALRSMVERWHAQFESS